MTSEEEKICNASFEIIAGVGQARSLYIRAIHSAEAFDFDQAGAYINEGKKAYLEGHARHTELLQQVVDGTETPVNMILAHAEDQLMSAEGFGILAEEFITVCKLIEGRSDV